MKSRSIFLRVLCLLSTIVALSCNDSPKPIDPDPNLGSVVGPAVSGDPHDFRGAGVIQDPKYLIGGPLAQGRVGDVLLQNGKVRLLIQKPGRYSGVGLYGGNIIDGDIVRPQGEPGQDQFGTTFPLINISWTAYYQKLEILNSDFSKGPVVLRATGVINVYDWIQSYIIVPFARIVKEVKLSFPNRFNDLLNPFDNIPELKKVSSTIVTDYILREDRSYVMIQTHLYNSGDKAVPFPIGDWVNGSGSVTAFVPGIGYIRGGYYDAATYAKGLSALAYPALEENVHVSYGYFHDLNLVANSDGKIRASEFLSFAAVTAVLLGEGLTDLLPFKANEPPNVQFKLPPGETVYTRYFAIGNGDVGSVMDAGMQALGVPTAPISGVVVDSLGNPVERARVVVMDQASKRPVTAFNSDAQGRFSGLVSVGGDEKSNIMGSGQYTIEVYKEGYVDFNVTWPTDPAESTPGLAGKNKAGQCKKEADQQIRCILGQTGFLQVSAKDEKGQFIPARLAIVGFDPSPFGGLPKRDDDKAKDEAVGLLNDMEVQSQQYGYIDTIFLDPSGKIASHGNARRVNDNTVRLEPGEYEIYLMRGPEYSQFVQRVKIPNGGTVNVDAVLKKVLDTKGYMSGDFHIHGIMSPDSSFGPQQRVAYAMAEGLDIMVATDHDVLFDYQPTINELGFQDYVAGIAGEEITPMAFGHFIAFPLQYDPSSPTGGAFDYTKKAGFKPGPSKHEVLAPEETLMTIDAQTPGEQVLQVNHFMDALLGNFFLSGLVTSTKFPGIPPLSTYSDPQAYRLPPNSNQAGNYSPPYPFGTSKMFTDKFTAAEICNGDSETVTFPNFYESSLPVWFSLLNLGKVATGTCNSDTHRETTRDPLGLFRNFIQMSIDPRDGIGSYTQLDRQEIAHQVNKQKVTVSGGVFVTTELSLPDGSQKANLGETLSLCQVPEKKAMLKIHVQSADWLDFDRVEVFVNTDPTPALDDLSGPWPLDKASDFYALQPEAFPKHVIPKYLYEPLFEFQRGETGEKALTQTIKDGKREVILEKEITFTEDSWVVVLAYGSDKAHSAFPFAPKAINTKAPEMTPGKLLDTLAAQRADLEGKNPDKIGGVKAFGFTNPIFVDVDCNGWEAKYIRDGQSPLKKK